MCATKLHGAKIDYERQPQAACTPGGFSVCNEVARSENRLSESSGGCLYPGGLRVCNEVARSEKQKQEKVANKTTS